MLPSSGRRMVSPWWRFTGERPETLAVVVVAELALSLAAPDGLAPSESLALVLLSGVAVALGAFA